jgi:transcriptional regulator with XRE-family HTH domain
VHPCPVTEERTETLAQLIAELRAEYDVTEPQIAAAIGVSVSAVNTWASGKRGGTRGPRRQSLEALAAEYPKFTRERIFAAAKRIPPADLDADAEARVLELYRGLTEEQRRMKEVEMRALNEMNRTGQ